MNALIYINSKPFPYPKRGLNFTVSSMVEASRNANGEIIGQRVGRDQYAIGTLEWPLLDAKTWSEILKEFENFHVNIRFPDMVNNRWVSLRMYPGDRSAEPYELDEDGFPIRYTNCKVSIADCGVV